MVVFVALGLCGCSRPLPVALDQADRLMLSDPGAALATLNGVDVSELGDSAAVARWALLYSEAMVANGIAAPTDTIVDIAIDYYRFHGLTDEFRRASELKALIMDDSETDALATALYLQREKEYFLYKERARRQLYFYTGLIIFLLALGVILWMRQRMRYQRVQNEALIAEASGLRCQLESGQGDVSRMESKLHALLDGRFTLIDSLCQTYYEAHGTPLERKAIVERVKTEIESVRRDSLPEMERVVNDCRAGLLTQVKKAFPEIKPDDYHLLVYICCGLSPRTISLLLEESVEVIYKRKSRLKARLKEHVEPQIPHILSIFQVGQKIC